MRDRSRTLQLALFFTALYLNTSCSSDDVSKNGDPIDIIDKEPTQKPCLTSSDCPAREHASATCTAQNLCEYACEQGWGDPSGEIDEQGCTCDKSLSSCQLTPSCGDGFVEGSELCDDGNQNNNDSCTNQCTPCGNSKLDPGERCDDGNSDDQDGCSSTCQVEDLWACDEMRLPSECWQEWRAPADRPLMKDYGRAISTWDNFAAVSAPYDSTYAQREGTVQIYQAINGSWRHVQELKPERDLNTSFFGHNILFTEDGDLIVIALGDDAPQDMKRSFLLFYKERDGKWTLQQTIEENIMVNNFKVPLSYHNNALVISGTKYKGNKGWGVIYTRISKDTPFTRTKIYYGTKDNGYFGGSNGIYNGDQQSVIFHQINNDNNNNNPTIQASTFDDDETTLAVAGEALEPIQNIVCNTKDTIIYTRTVETQNATYSQVVVHDKDTSKIIQILSPDKFDSEHLSHIYQATSIGPKNYRINASCKTNIITIQSRSLNEASGGALVYQQEANGLLTPLNVSFNIPSQRKEPYSENNTLQHATAGNQYGLYSDPPLNDELITTRNYIVYPFKATP